MVDTKTKAQLSLTAVPVFVAVVSGLVGIPGMIDDLGMWQEWIVTAREVIPWQLAMTLSAGSLVVAILPWVPWNRVWNRRRVMNTAKVPVESTKNAEEDVSGILPITRYERETQEFRLLEEEAAFVLEYLEGVEIYENDRPFLLEARVYALEDNLKSLGVSFPKDDLDAMTRLLGLIKSGNLDEARKEFLWYPF